MTQTESFQHEEPLQEYRPGSTELWGWFVIGAVVIVSYVALWLLVLSPEVALALGVATIVVAGSCLAVGYRRTTARVLVFSNGFSFQQGGRPVFFPWEAIQSVWDQSHQIL